MAYPTRDLEVPMSFFLSPSSLLTRLAREIAEIRRGFHNQQITKVLEMQLTSVQ
jgi:hypothetical protein